LGLAPALQASRSDQSEGLRKVRGGNAGGARSNRMRSLLMVAEIAMSFMLLVGAGLLIKSFMHLREVKPASMRTMCLRCAFQSAGKFPAGEPRVQFFQQAIDHIHSLPGVQFRRNGLSLPLGGDTFNVWRGYIREGRPATPEENGDAAFLAATPDYSKLCKSR